VRSTPFVLKPTSANHPRVAERAVVNMKPAPARLCLLDGLSAGMEDRSIDCSLVATRNSAFVIFLRFLTPAKSAICSDSPRRRILTFWTSAQMGQDDWGNHDRFVLAYSWRSISSHGGSLTVPGWPQTSRVREGSLVNTQGDKAGFISSNAVSGQRPAQRTTQAFFPSRRPSAQNRRAAKRRLRSLSPQYRRYSS